MCGLNNKNALNRRNISNLYFIGRGFKDICYIMADYISNPNKYENIILSTNDRNFQSPMEICGLFAIEFFLKQIYIIDSMKKREENVIVEIQGHDIKKLYDNLEELNKTRIDEIINELNKINLELADFNDFLNKTRYGNDYYPVTIRYYSNKKENYDFDVNCMIKIVYALGNIAQNAYDEFFEGCNDRKQMASSSSFIELDEISKKIITKEIDICKEDND